MPSFESTLRSPPRGPARWGWVVEAMNKIAKMRNVISNDASIEVDETTGGLSLKRILTGAAAGDLRDDPFQLTFENGGWFAKGGRLQFNDNPSSVVTVEDKLLPAIDPFYAIVRVPLELTVTGAALTPRFDQKLEWATDVQLQADPEMTFAAASSFALYPYLTPTVISHTVLQIPVAYVEGGAATQWWHGLAGMNIDLYHSHFTVRRIE